MLLNTSIHEGLPVTFQESLAAGAYLVCFSGDKLRGGPQAGIIAGKAPLVRKLAAQPMARALRGDYARREDVVLQHVATGRQLAVDVRSLVFAGINATGRVVQTAAGPFAGALQFAGQGINGRVQLADQAGNQRADIAARAYNARVPGAVDFTIGRAIVNASVVMVPKAPQVVADVQVGDTRYNAFVIQAMRAKVNYAGGRGTAQAVLNGSSGVPLRLAINARLSPDAYLVAAQGQANGIPFRTGNPARITAGRGTYSLAPTRIDFGQGSNAGAMRVAGSFGGGVTAAQARLDSLNLSILSAFVPNLGVSGAVTGSLDYRQQGQAIPAADARLTIANFQRTGLSAVSEPVDVQVIGKLLPDGGEMRALVKRGPMAIGRLLATLRPLPPGAGSWTTRLMQAPLGGGIRYNGPSAVLFSLAALPNQQLSGPIAVAADFSGRVSAPQLNGLIRADNLTYDNETYGTRLSQMKIAARFNNDRLELTGLTARAGSGTVQAQGTIGLAADAGFPIDVRARLDNAQLAKSDAVAATSSGTIRFTNSKDGALLKGDLTVPDARYQIIRQGAAEVPELTGVRRKNPNGQDDTPAQAIRRSFGDFDLNLRINADNRLFVNGMGLAGAVDSIKVVSIKDEPFFVMSGDGISDIDLSAMWRFHARRGSVATMATKRVDARFEYGVRHDRVADSAGHSLHRLQDGNARSQQGTHRAAKPCHADLVVQLAKDRNPQLDPVGDAPTEASTHKEPPPSHDHERGNDHHPPVVLDRIRNQISKHRLQFSFSTPQTRLCFNLQFDFFRSTT